MDDLDLIYEELLHIKALSHLSNSIKRELYGVMIFESHATSGTIRKFLLAFETLNRGKIFRIMWLFRLGRSWCDALIVSYCPGI